MKRSKSKFHRQLAGSSQNDMSDIHPSIRPLTRDIPILDPRSSSSSHVHDAHPTTALTSSVWDRVAKVGGFIQPKRTREGCAVEPQELVAVGDAPRVLLGRKRSIDRGAAIPSMPVAIPSSDMRRYSRAGTFATTTPGNNTPADTPKERKRRGKTSAIDIWAWPEGKTEDILVTDDDGLVGPNLKHLKRFMTSIGNNVSRLPLVIRTDPTYQFSDWKVALWSDLSEYLDTAYKEILRRFVFLWVEVKDIQSALVPIDHVKTLLRKCLNIIWHSYKHNLYTNRVANRDLPTVIASVPYDMSKPYWEALVSHFMSESFQASSRRGKINQGMQEFTHRLGAQTLSQWSYNKKQKTGRAPDRVERHDRAYSSKEGVLVSRLALENSIKMHRLMDYFVEAYTKRGHEHNDELRRYTADIVVKEVMGPDCHGRVRYVNMLIGPKKYYAIRHPHAVRPSFPEVPPMVPPLERAPSPMSEHAPSSPSSPPPERAPSPPPEREPSSPPSPPPERSTSPPPECALSPPSSQGGYVPQQRPNDHDFGSFDANAVHQFIKKFLAENQLDYDAHKARYNTRYVDPDTETQDDSGAQREAGLVEEYQWQRKLKGKRVLQREEN